MPQPDAPHRSPRVHEWILGVSASLAGVLGVGAAWMSVGMVLGGSVPWMALVAALDAVLLLRLVGFPGGGPAGLLAAFATLATAALSNWLLAAAVVGQMVGLPLHESALRMGADHAFALARLSNGWTGLALIVVACIVAGVAAAVSGRRRAPLSR